MRGDSRDAYTPVPLGVAITDRPGLKVMRSAIAAMVDQMTASARREDLGKSAIAWFL